MNLNTHTIRVELLEVIFDSLNNYIIKKSISTNFSPTKMSWHFIATPPFFIIHHNKKRIINGDCQTRAPSSRFL